MRCLDLLEVPNMMLSRCSSAWILAVPILLQSAPAVANSPPAVTNVTAQQIAGTGLVRVTYDVEDTDGDQVTVRLICSSDNGGTFDLLPTTVSGDINEPMSAGTGKQITWDAAHDYPGRYWEQVVAKVIASDGQIIAGEMVLVPAGPFPMGSTLDFCSQPVHQVTLDSFYIDKYEVTNAEFEQFINLDGYETQAYWSPAGWGWRTAGSFTAPANWGSADHRSGPAYPGFPVHSVCWYEAEAYANFAGKRLPTEAEWEKAARGDDQRTYPWGEGVGPPQANYWESYDPFESGGARVTPVGFYDGRLHPNPPFQTTNAASPYGAYDLAGNVEEWVQDWFACNYYSYSPPSNPQGPATGSTRCFRGGPWDLGYLYLASYLRSNADPSLRPSRRGFRCARSIP